MIDTHRPHLHKVPVYEVRLVKTRRPLLLREPLVDGPSAAALTLHALIGLADREHFACLFLTVGHHITGAHVAAIGGQASLVLEPRTVLRAAVAACAAGIVLSHNHPSGDPTPSSEDLATTKRLMEAADILGVPVLDHIIVTRDQRVYHSMVDRGTLPSRRS
jgi:DNA repair protein RadC